MHAKRTVVWMPLTAMILAAPAASAPAGVTVVDRPNARARNDHYVSNRPPLRPSALVKLPIGSIRPHGWLREQLRLQADGFLGRLPEISRFLKKKDNAWRSPDGTGRNGWEEVPYWLKGFGDLGYVLGDRRILAESREWIDAAIAGQRDDGYFGPRSNLNVAKNGKPDLWPNMVMLNVLQSYHEHSGDRRVLDLMTKYFAWQRTIGEKDLLPPYWQQQRAADNLASIYWLYNRTGEKALLELAPRIHRHTARWTDGVPNWHNVNMTQAFRGPAIYFQQSGDPNHLAATERNWREIRRRYGQVPGGLFGGDENCRPGYVGPRQAVETCGMVEMMLSCEMLLAIDGETRWADRCEDVAFNSLPAATTVDLKALRYLTAPNLVRSDRRSHSPGFQNGGPMLLMDPHRHRCCQHNMGHGWPYYAEHLWYATGDNGLAAVLYSASEVTAKVGGGTEVRITQTTRYPFDDRVELALATPKPVAFALYLRVPGWCDAPKLEINGQPADVQARAGAYLRIERTWADGDKVALSLPPKIALRTWTSNGGCVSVDRGALTYSLKIGEKHVRAGGTDDWPAWEILPTTPWNYGLVLNAKAPGESLEFAQGTWPKNDRPWDVEAAPVTLRAAARKIPAWQIDKLGLVGRMHQSPVASDEPVETVTLIPMGCARLRIAAFPVVAKPGQKAHAWPVPTRIVEAASHCFAGDTLSAMTDGLLPKASNDTSIPRFTWWDHCGSAEWAQLTFPKPRTVSAVEVYWFDDTGKGRCRLPKSWRLVYRDGKRWKPVSGASEYGCRKDRFNRVTFDAVTTTSLRIEVQLQATFSGGILEWRVAGK